MLLESTNKKVIEISADLGFNSVTTFLREFKKEYGISPSDMRQRIRKEQEMVR